MVTSDDTGLHFPAKKEESNDETKSERHANLGKASFHFSRKENRDLL